MNFQFSYDEPPENLYKRMESWTGDLQLRIALELKEPMRSNILNMIVNARHPNLGRDEVEQSRQRFDNLSVVPEGHTLLETERHRERFLGEQLTALLCNDLKEPVEAEIGEAVLELRRRKFHLDRYEPAFLDGPDANIDEQTKIERYLSYLQSLLSDNAITEVPINAKREGPNAPVLGLFCKLISESGIIEKRVGEGAQSYCKRICDVYNLTYTDRVRQNFGKRLTKENLKELRKVLIPSLDPTTQSQILDYLNSKEL